MLLETLITLDFWVNCSFNCLFPWTYFLCGSVVICFSLQGAPRHRPGTTVSIFCWVTSTDRSKEQNEVYSKCLHSEKIWFGSLLLRHRSQTSLSHLNWIKIRLCFPPADLTDHRFKATSCTEHKHVGETQKILWLNDLQTRSLTLFFMWGTKSSVLLEKCLHAQRTRLLVFCQCSVESAWFPTEQII